MTQDGSRFTHTFDDERHLTIASGMTNGPYCYVYEGNGRALAPFPTRIPCVNNG